MSAYDTAALALRNSLIPIRDYCDKERERLDPSDSKHQFRFKHVKQLEEVRETARDFYQAAEADRERYAEICRINRFLYQTQQRLAFYKDPAPLSRTKLDQYFTFPSQQAA